MTRVSQEVRPRVDFGMFSMEKDFFSDKKILVMGLGRFGGGLDAARFGHEAGAAVTVTDMATADDLRDSVNQLEALQGVQLVLGRHEHSDFAAADIVIVNPAVPPDSPYIKTARDHGAKITSQIAIFFELCPVPIIGITGANGKSTTTALTAHLLHSILEREPETVDYRDVRLGGNIGNHPLLTTLGQIEPDDLVVLELSSFQLEQLAEIEQAPHVALLTNLTPNHLDRHGTFEAYRAAKENIFKWQQPRDGRPAISIFNAEDPVAVEFYHAYRTDSARISICFGTTDVPDTFRRAFALPGPANISNLAAALAIVRRFGLSDAQILAALPSFKGLPHRLELVGEFAGVRWYNDSIATTGPSTIAALDAFGCPIVLIAGGYDKKLPFDELGRVIARKAKAAVLIGQTAAKIAAAIEAGRDSTQAAPTVRTAASLAEAVDTARQLAEAGDAVVLSPACASYDMFTNFQHRGDQFSRLARDRAP